MYQDFIQAFTAADIALLLANLLLLLFAKRILRLLSSAEPGTRAFSRRLSIFRSLNGLVILVNLYYHLPYLSAVERGGWLKLVMILMLVYMSYLGLHIIQYGIRLRYGKEREINGETRYVETYASRLLSMMAATLVMLVVIIAIIRILGFDSLLEAGGVVGFIGVLLALTQGSWAPDIFAGLIILNSNVLEEGDVVELQDCGQLSGVVYKTKVFHTEILNAVNNHRVMISNSRLRGCIIHNLSKFASAKGLREELRFKIGYEVPAAKVRALFSEAFSRLDPGVVVEKQHPVEIVLLDTGDHALEWGFFYYLKDVRRLHQTRHQVRETILVTALEQGISLATPFTHVVTENAGAMPRDRQGDGAEKSPK